MTNPAAGRVLREERTSRGLCPWCGERAWHAVSACPHGIAVARLANLKAMAENCATAAQRWALLPKPGLFADGLEELRQLRDLGCMTFAKALEEERLRIEGGLP